MKIIKPMRLGILHKTYDFKQQHHCVVSPLVFFKLAEFDSLATSQGEIGEVLIENIQWPKIQEVLGNDILDMVMPKPKAECLIAGSAYNPNGNDSDTSNNHFQAAFELGDIRKVINVYGERYWQKGLVGYSASIAQPVSSVTLQPENSYGGPGFQDNPAGSGYYQDKSAQPLRLAPIEAPNEAIRSIRHKPAPAGLGTIAITHSQRAQYNGSYTNQSWLDKHFPALAPDTDMRLFMAARPDQHLPTFLTGTEAYTLINLHPTAAIMSGYLPHIRPRAFVTREAINPSVANPRFTKIADQLAEKAIEAQLTESSANEAIEAPLQLEELPLQLDTAWFFPDQGIGALIYRGQTQVLDPDALDISNILLAYENIADTARPVDYYQTVLHERLDPKTAALVALDESQLAPEKSAQQLADEQQALLEEQAAADILAAEQQTQAKQDALDAMAKTEINSQALSKELDSLEPAKAEDILLSKDAIARGDINLKALHAHVQQQEQTLRAEQQALQAELEAQQAELQKMPVVNKALAQQQADTNNDAVKNAKIDFAEVSALTKQHNIDLDDTQLQQLESLQKLAPLADTENHQDWPSDAEAQAKRTEFLAALNSGQAMHGRDWSGCDLSGLTLNNINLAQCQFSNCDFSQSTLQDCNLEQASFTGAKFQNSTVHNCNMQQSNFSAVTATDSLFTHNQLHQAMLVNAIFCNCNWQQSRWVQVSVLESTMTKCQFTDVHWQSVTALQCNLNDSDFTRLAGNMVTIMRCQLAMSRWLQAKLTRSAFLECHMPLNSFAEVHFLKCQFSVNNQMLGCVWQQAKLEQCGFRRIDGRYWKAQQAQFVQCDMGDSDFHYGRFQHAIMRQVILSDARCNFCHFNHCNFYTALLRKTQMQHCNLQQANFLEADALLTVATHSNFKDALNVAPMAMRRWQDAQRNAA